MSLKMFARKTLTAVVIGLAVGGIYAQVMVTLGHYIVGYGEGK